MKHKVAVSINGRNHEHEVESRLLLVHYLRHVVGLTGTHIRCATSHRRADPRLVSGEGRYIDDFTRPGTLFLAVVRSPHAHARIKSIDVTAATKAAGVAAVYTHKDIAKVIAGTMPAAPAFVAEKKQ